MTPATLARGLLGLAVLLSLLLPVRAAAGTGPDVPREKLHVYILLGGPDMCGRASYDNEDAGPIPRCWLLDREGKWERADNPLNRHSTIIERLDTQKLGPGYTFARTMLGADPSVSLGLVVNAQDGASLELSLRSTRQASITQWLKGTAYYDEMLKRAKAAREAGTLKGVLWLQGDADAKDGQYLDKLKALIGDLRADLGEPNLAFVAGELLGGSPINGQLAKLPAALPNAGVASAEGIKDLNTHGTDGMKLMGRRFAEAMLKLQGKEVPAEAAAAPEEKLPPPPAGSGYDGPKEKLRVYLLVGQSNMAGRAPYTVADGAVIERCWLLDRDDRWEPAKLPLNRYASIVDRADSNALSPGYGFAKTMLEKDPNLNIGLVSNARGSTSINQWLPGTKYYKEALRRLQAAGQSGTISGILWHQGESDEKDANYIEKLKKLVEGFRQDLNDPNLPFVAGQINNVPLINGQIDRLPGLVPRTGVASADGLKAMDRWHFDNASAKLLGQRYAEEMIKILGAH